MLNLCDSAHDQGKVNLSAVKDNEGVLIVGRFMRLRPSLAIELTFPTNKTPGRGLVAFTSGFLARLAVLAHR